MRILSNGMGQPEPDALAARGPVYMSGQVWYVNSATGADAVSPRGLTEEYPLATLKQACTNATSGDVIVLMSNHTETVASQIALVAKNLIILGGGSSGGKPTVKVTNNVLSSAMFTADANSTVRLRNIWFPQPAGAATAPTVSLSGVAHVDGCYFECGSNNNTGAYALTGPVLIVEDTTCVSVTTDKTDRPERAIYITSAMTQGQWRNNTLDGGTFGFDSYAMEFEAATHWVLETLSLLRGADILIHASATGVLQLGTVTGGSRVNW